MPTVLLSGTTPTTVTHLADVITGDMVSGLFNEIFGLLPVLIPTAVTFLAVRKGLSFFLGFLRKA